MSGPLEGRKIIELAGIGPGPMCAMTLADLGATVLRIERPVAVDLGIKRPLKYDLLQRGRKAIALDLKAPAAIDFVLKLVEGADGLIEGFRPGVTERMGLGPEACLARNPKLVYGRMTGWGQTGPLAHAAGHDLNYIAITGALHAIGRKDQPPTPPLTFVGDMGGGGIYLALGMLAAMLSAQHTGRGQVVDAAIVDGAAHLATTLFGLAGAGILSESRGDNIMDSGSFFYEVYRCSDGKWVSIAPIEPKFYRELLDRLGVDPSTMPPQMDRKRWDEGKAILGKIFLTKTRDEWCSLLEGTDVCFAPVLTFAEASEHHHLQARGTFIEIDGVVQPAPAPRFSATPSGLPSAPLKADNTPAKDALDGWVAADDVERLLNSGVLVQPSV